MALGLWLADPWHGSWASLIGVAHHPLWMAQSRASKMILSFKNMTYEDGCKGTSLI